MRLLLASFIFLGSLALFAAGDPLGLLGAFVGLVTVGYVLQEDREP